MDLTFQKLRTGLDLKSVLATSAKDFEAVTEGKTSKTCITDDGCSMTADFENA